MQLACICLHIYQTSVVLSLCWSFEGSLRGLAEGHLTRNSTSDAVNTKACPIYSCTNNCDEASSTCSMIVQATPSSRAYQASVQRHLSDRSLRRPLNKRLS